MTRDEAINRARDMFWEYTQQTFIKTLARAKVDAEALTILFGSKFIAREVTIKYPGQKEHKRIIVEREAS